MKLPLYQIDAFTNILFKGNPAAVCPLDVWLEDEKLKAIAAENNLSETAFFVEKNGGYELRWFTPKCEVDLCGHATLAAAFVIFQFINKSLEKVEFSTKSGILSVEQNYPLLSMNFPARPASPCSAPEELLKGLGVEPEQVLLSRDYLVVYDSEEKIRTVKPDMNYLVELDAVGIIITAPGEKSDFVSRFFAPKVGIPEDPVTGSAHCTLIPYWSERLNKTKLHAFQLSERGGELFCEYSDPSVKISGHAVKYLEGFIDV